MDHLEGILKLTTTEMESIIKNGKFRSREEIDSVGKLVDIVKDIHCIWEYEDDGYDDGEEASYARGRRGGRSYRSGEYDGYSGRRRRRDSMGRFSGNSSYRDYSGGDKQEYMEHLREMMRDAPDEQTRQSIQRLIDKM